MTLRSRCWRGQRLGFIHYINTEYFQWLVAVNFGVMHHAGGNRIGIAGFQVQIRLALDDEISFALQNVAGLDTGMGMTSRRAAGLDFGNAGDRDVTFRKFDLLQRRALDAALLSDGCTRAGECDDGQSEKNFLDHDFLSL